MSLCAENDEASHYERPNVRPIYYKHRGKTGVTADRDKIEFRLLY